MKANWLVIGLLSLGLGCGHFGIGKAKSDGECCRGEEKEEKNEVKMSFAEAPAAVQAALTREAGGAKIEKVDKETRDGKTVYEADAMSGGKNWEIVVDEQGTVISKKVDEESGEKKHEKEEDDEKDEKGEKK